MYAPRGFAQTRTSPRNIPICKTPTLVMVLSSELLRTEQSVNKVNKEPQRGNPGNDVFHVPLLELVAGLCEGPTNEQKTTTDGNIKQVKHGRLPPFGENDLVTRAPQFPRQPLFASRAPPAFTAANHDHRSRTQRTLHGLDAVAAQIQPNGGFHGALARDHAKASFVPVEKNRRTLEWKGIWHYLRHDKRDPCSQTTRQCACLFQGRERRLHRREDYGDV